MIATTLFGCPPRVDEGNANVTWAPTVPASDRHFWSSEPVVVYLEDRNRLVAAFNDQEGVFTIDPSVPGKLRPKSVTTQAGVAFSDDGGKTWQRPSPRQILPPDPNNSPQCFGLGCGNLFPLDPCDTECATSLAGDPWLATNGSRVLLVNMAQQHGLSYRTAPSAVVVSRSSDGVSWSVPKVVGSAEDVDKPSVSFVGFTAAITYATGSEEIPFTGVQIVTSDDEGASWSSPQLLDLDFAANQPIIKLTGPRTGYLSYSLPHRVRVARLTRDADTGLWAAETILAFDRIDYDEFSQIIGGGPTGAIPVAYTRWRDVYPFSFDVGDINYQTGTAHLYFADRERRMGSASSVYLFDCRDGGSGTPGDCGRGAWRRRSFHLPSPPRTPVDQQFGSQFQPIVAAGRIGGDVALAWYQTIGTYDFFNRQQMTVYARRSTDGADTFDAARAIDPRLWSACASKEPANFYYGDYIGMVIPTRLNTSQPLSTVTLYTSSVGGCINQEVPLGMDATTFDQHVESASW